MIFWQDKTLDELSDEEWEALCDGCGLCCLHKLQDEDDGALYYTDIACHSFDSKRCRCQDYHGRNKVEMCLNLREMRREDFSWLPRSCAYRLRANGQALPDWHYLIAGSKTKMHVFKKSAKGRVINEKLVPPDEWQERVVRWV